MRVTPRARARSRAVLGAASLFFAATVAVFWRALFFGETFTDRDLSVFWRPARAVLVRLLAEAPSFPPLWNPYFAEGQPFSANPHHAVLHPLTLLFALLPFEWAFRLQILLPPVLTAAGMYVFLRTLGRSHVASLFGGATWGFGGLLLSTTNLIPILFTLAPLPFTLAFAIRASRRRGARNIAGLALSFGMQCLGGEAASLALSTLLVLAALLSETKREQGTRGALFPLAGLALGVLCGGASLFPGLLHARDTLRASGLPDSQASVAAFPPGRISEIVFPYILGHVEAPDSSAFWGSRVYGSEGFPLIFGIYAGLAVPVLVGALLWTGRGNRCFRVWPWLAASAAGWILAMGPALPLWPLLRALPVVSGIRYPEKFVALSVFPLVVLAAHGLDLARVRGRAWRAALGISFTLAGLAALGGIVMALGPLALTGPASFLREGLLESAVTGLLLTAVLVQRRFDRRPLILGLTVLELAIHGNRLVGTRPESEVWRAPAFLAPAIEELREKPLYHLSAISRQPALPPMEIAATPVPAQWGIPLALEEDFDLTQLRWSTEASIAVWKIASGSPRLLAPVLARRGIGAVIAPRTGSDGQVVTGIVKPSVSRPLAFLAERVELTPDARTWSELMRTLGGAAAGTVCLMGEAPPRLARPPGRGTATILKSRPGLLEMAVNVEGSVSGVLAVNQTWDRGWRAEAGGVAVPILRADISLMALEVPPGRHSVSLVYEAPAVLWSWLGSAAAFLLSGLLLFAREKGRPG
ncbi:MAG: hypothetical protein IT186_17165 [Acidobacteria bacterium]|nr:hypothetical protein [Acidobacteriota bacterium]